MTGPIEHVSEYDEVDRYDISIFSEVQKSHSTYRGICKISSMTLNDMFDIKTFSRPLEFTRFAIARNEFDVFPLRRKQ